MPVINWTARLAVTVPTVDVDEAQLWYVTHGLGSIAAGTYTEVAFATAVPRADQTPPAGQPPALHREVVRRVARELYGERWSNLYPPEEYVDAVARWDMRLRERIVVTDLEAWGES